MADSFKCPVCGKGLTKEEYISALGLWKEQQEHINHLKAEQKKFKEKEKSIKQSLEKERQRLKVQESRFRQQTAIQVRRFKADQSRLQQETRKQIGELRKRNARELQNQRDNIKKSLEQKMKGEIRKGVAEGVEQQKAEFKKQQSDLKKTKSKMNLLENSLKVSAGKYEQANKEIKKLREQIEKGVTPQIEGLYEEDKLLAKLKELFPTDKFEHPGKGGDIIQYVLEQGKEAGKIVYECKKVKAFNKSHVEQAKNARRQRNADFAILVTNAFPSKKQYYFVEKTVFVISAISLEPITYTLRESLIRMALLRLTNEAKQKAVQRVYEFLSSSEYNNKMNDVANQLVDLAKDLKVEIKSHRDRWEKRYSIYGRLFSDVSMIDFKLKGLLQGSLSDKTKLLASGKKEFVEIEELG